MEYKVQDFVAFTADAQRVMANLEQAYVAWVEARRALEQLPVSMYWQTKGSTDYLTVKYNSADPGKSLGPRSPQTEALYESHQHDKAMYKDRAHKADALVSERAGLYRRLRLPALPDQQAEILRSLDTEDLLGTDLMVVGTNAFVAYQLACNARFPAGDEETEDFDLTWCRGSKASLSSAGKEGAGKTLLGVLRKIDASYRINPRKPYQARNDNGYEVELLAAPSTHPLPKGEAFEPMVSLIEQEWLLQGRPLSVVVATLRGRACPLYVPDPRWMALHKLWLARKPERNAAKRPKDQRQGEVLLDATRHFLPSSHPLDVGFVMDLPEELRPHFDNWCQSRQFVPQP